MTTPLKATRHHCVLQWNCRGLANKVGELRYRLALGKLPAWCLLLQETNSLPRIPGFTAYDSPTIPDRRCTNALGPPGKAAVYVVTTYPQTQVPLLQWCNQWQEVVAVLVRLPRTDVIVVSVYVRPYSGSAPRLRLGWLAHLRQTYPGCPVLVGGDFNAPHQSWGYPSSSARGNIVLDTFTDAHFVLLNAPATSTRRWDHPCAPPYAPDLSWWLGMCDVSWDLEPDCWGSDHHPLKIGLAAYNQRRLRRRCYTTNWDLFRNELNDSIADTSSDPLQVLTRAVQAATQSSWVEENRPHPNLHLLRLWAARRRAELALNRDPAAAELRDNLNRLTAAARRCEKRLARERWMDWCASLGPSSSTASIWRTFRSMELGTRTPDPAASACLSSGCTPSQFAPEIVKAFFPAYNLAPPQFDCPCNLPPEVGVTPSPSDIEGMQAPYTMAELQAAIDQAKVRKAPGPDGISYEVFKNMDGPALQWLLDTLNAVWTTGGLPESWKHAEVVPIPKPGKHPNSLSNLRPIALTCTLCKLLERMLASRISWWLEKHAWYHPAQIGFRPHLGTEDGLDHLTSMVLVGRRSSSIRTLLAMDVHKAYDNVSHSAINHIMQWLQLPPRVCDFVESFLAHRTFCIRVGKERTGHFVMKRGVPQGSVLAPILFNIALLPLAWQLARIPDAFFLLYADDLTVWTLHPDLQRQQEALQSALDKASDWCARIGLTLSATKTAFMSITNRRGRRRLLQTPICLSLNGHTLTPVSTIRVLGVELDASGSANAWVRSARRKSANTLHLIRRISQKTGGACSRMARILVRSILQPRLVYQAQFQRLTLRDWDLLETANRDSMRAITCLPRMTPITTLQAEAQLNTIDEIVHQRRVARYLKSQAVPAAAALAHYYGSTLPQPDAPVAEVPPWLKAQASDNRPLTRLRQSTRQAAQEGIVTTTENSLAVYVDAATDNCVLHTSLVCPAQPEIQHICSYVTEAPFPSVLAELTAIRDGLTVMISKMDSLSHDKLLVYTDSTQAVRELRKVTSSIDIASDIHRLIHSCACPVRVLWTRRSAPAQVEADAACHPATVQHPLPLLRLSPKDSLLVHKETLRRSTRALIPPRGSDLPGGLTRREEVALRRIRVGAALTPAIRATWTSGAQPPPTTCPFCVAPATEATLDHLLGTCPGLHQARTRHLRGLHHHPGRPPDLTRWTHGPLHRQLLAFIQETKLFLFI